MTAANPTWHVEQELLRSWVDGCAGPVQAASVEQHVARCGVCRERVADAISVDAPSTLPDLGLVWAGVRNEIELPRPARSQRVLRRVGLSESDALLLASAPSMRAAWLNAVALVLAFVLVAGSYGDTKSVFLFLICAPLIPMVGVALTYGSGTDVAFEQEVATPYSPLRLVLLRTAAVLGTSIPLVLLGGLFKPTGLAVAWLVPALGFTALILAASSWIDPALAAATLGAGWIAVVLVSAANGAVAGVYGPVALAVYALMGVLAAFVFVHRVRRTGTLGGLL